MKKRNLLLLLIPILLVSIFSFNLFAEEDPESELGIAEPLPIPSLDSYFYDNYVLLPYIQSDLSQFINTSIKTSSELKIGIKFSDLVMYQNNDYYNIFGSWTNNGNDRLYLAYSNNYYDDVDHTDQTRFAFGAGPYNYSFNYNNYYIYSIVFDKNEIYLNNNLVHIFTYNSFSNNLDLYLFARNNDGTNSSTSALKLYSFYIYDYSLSDPNDQESDPVGYVRYYYPARSKSGDVIGLYDAVSKTFVTTSTASPFVNPTGSDAELSLSAGITTTLLAGLGWIGDILTYAISEPVILLFMAIALAGVMFRWGRKIVHF